MEEVNMSSKFINLKGEILARTDEPSAKVRKPYTITKQRERWTEEEHKNFLEALKLYGRAWQKIEEHIGTKTAVQIRSHAQKFFSKLEREASLGKSEGPGVAQDPEVPPPRPKRKPIHPYPRKAGAPFSCKKSAFGGESKTSAAVCSAFNPFGGPKKSSLRVLEIKKTPEQVLPQSGPSTSLRLFGQTFVFPLPENGETLTTCVAQANAENSPFDLVTIIDAAESGHEIEVSAQSVCVSASCKYGGEAREKSVSTVQFEDTFGLAATTESSKVETSNACLDECDAAESSNEHSMHVSSMVTECSDNDEGCPVDGHHLERTSPLLGGFSSTPSLPPFLNSELPHPVKTVAMNCMRYLQEQSNKLLPHFPVETVLLNRMRHSQEESNEFHMRTDSDNSERLSLTARSWANPISGSSLHDERQYDIGAVDASNFSAFMLALQGAFLPESVPPFKREKVYNPVAVLASEVPSFLSSMYPLKPGIPGRKQDANAACINTGTRKHSDFFQEQGVSNEKKDELAASIKEQVPVNTAKTSKECYRSSEDEGRGRCYKSSYCPAVAGPAIKRIKRSLSKKMENIHEASGSFSGSNMVASNNDCERKGDEKSLFCPSKAYSDRQDPTICNLQRSTFSLFGEENGDCSVQRICSARSYVVESEGRSDLFARLDIESGDPGMKFGSVDGDKGCLLPDDDESMLVNVGETNTQELTRQPRSKPFDWKQRKQKKSDLDYSATHNNNSLRAWESFSEDYESELHLAQLTKTLSNEEQCPCNNCAEEGKNCLNFPCKGLQSTILRVDVNDNMEGSMQSESAHRCIDVAEGLGKRMPLVKAETLKVFKRYSGAGFVPYWKFLEDAKLKFTGR